MFAAENGWPAECNGARQSPINIVSASAGKQCPIDNMDLTDHKLTELREINLENNGHTVQLNVVGQRIRLSGGGLSSHGYGLKQVLFNIILFVSHIVTL